MRKEFSLRGAVIFIGLFACVLGHTSGVAAKSIDGSFGEQPRVNLPAPGCYGSSGEGGGGMPDPLDYNQHVELADGEIYLLAGTVRMLPIAKSGSMQLRPHFEVDLKAQRWLASSARKASPYYLLEGASSTWKQHADEFAELVVRAHFRVLTDRNGVSRSVVMLERIASL